MTTSSFPTVQPLQASRPSIACSAFNLTQRRRGLRRGLALNQVSLNLEQGRWHALAGHTGSGAGELLRCLAGLEVADSGRVFLGGVELSSLDEAERARVRNATSAFVGPQPTPVALADAVSRALATHPRILFLDTIGGAPAEGLLSVLRRATAEDGLSVILATEDPEIALLADRALVFNNGRIAADL